jgi:hypothetical protein
MDDKILKRFEAKLDIIIGLLEDRSLTADEAGLLAEADVIVRRREYQELVRL